ncbi:MAG: ribonuclease E inhibitor RraB [Planctomycetota bacterium]|jgi:hypothetical protein
MHNHEGDDTLFEVFKQLGIDFSKSREVNFYFVFPTQEDAQGAMEDLSKIDFESEVFRYEAPWWKRLFVKPSWCVSTTREMALEETEIKRLTTAFTSIATRHRGEYDGWEANVAEDNIDASSIDS